MATKVAMQMYVIVFQIFTLNYSIVPKNNAIVNISALQLW
jgi:hypothetical protein